MSARPPLAVVGLSALFPGSKDKAGFWRDILAGRDLISDVPETHWLISDYYDPDPNAPDKTYAKRGAFLSPADFDPLEHGIPPNVVPATDSSQLLALIAAKQVLDDALSGQFNEIDRDRASVILGVTSGQELLVEMGARLQRPVWVKALREEGLPEDEVQRACDRIAASYVPWQENTFPGLLGNVIAGRIANRLNLGGTNCITDAACASSFSALAMGANELYLGQSDLVIVGGVETFNDIFMYMCFSKTPALSPSGDCRPFSKSADGTLLGEGLAMLALRRLEDAERDGNHIYAVVRGIGSSSDGRNKSVYAPVPEGQAKALRRAYAAAGYGPDTVDLVEAHGTGTKAGDVAEFEGLRQVFDESGRAERQWCALGTVKSQVGHTKAAAGAAGLFKIVMALHPKVLPPTIKVDAPHPGLRIEETPFYLNTETRPWVKRADAPRRASVSSFGFGGSNFHITAEEYRGAGRRAERTAVFPSELLLLAEADPRALIAKLRSLRADAPIPGVLPALARATQQAFASTAPARLALVASDEADLARKLDAALAAIETAPESPFVQPGGTQYALGAMPGRIAFLFPGQGSQYLGMGAEVALAFEAARAVWDEAAALPLTPALQDVVFPRPVFDDAARAELEQRLTATEWAQPALGATSASLLALLRLVGVVPDAVLGHSFGEVTALHAAGAFDLPALLRVSRDRGERMAQAASRPGAMLAVVGGPGDVVDVVESSNGRLVIANLNSPRQVVLSGETDAVVDAERRLRERGLSVKRLKVATAFHSSIVAGSCQPFREFLRDVSVAAPEVPVLANATATAYPSDADAIRTMLADQLGRPVRFAETIEHLYASGVRSFVEVGPAAVLSGLVGECLKGRPHLALSLDRKGQNGVTSLWNALGALAVNGVPLDLARLHEGVAAPRDPRLHPKAAHTMAVSGANYAKPYPPPGGTAALPKPNPPRSETDARRPAQASVPARAASDADSLAWVQAYQEVQRQTAEAHQAYLKTMAESHTAFLKSAEASYATLGALLHGTALPLPLAAAAPIPNPVEMRAAPKLDTSAALAPPLMPAPSLPAVVSPAAPASAAPDLKTALLEIVAEKTGYPADMLTFGMDLESDLGIDSIKRVEILAAMQQRMPGLPEIQPGQMAKLRTLDDVVRFLGAAATTPEPTAATIAVDLKTALLAVVAEKTGYPVEMLRMEMELEADLGIDSIKRVEILAALQAQTPGLPEVKAAEMAALRTLGQIVAKLDGAAGPPAPAPPAKVSVNRAARPSSRLVVIERDAPAIGAALPGLLACGTVCILDDQGGIAEALAVALARRGIVAQVAQNLPDDTRAVISLFGLKRLESIADALAVQRESFAVARALASRVGDGGLFVTVQNTGGDFGLSARAPLAAWVAGLAGLAKTASHEWPQADVRAIDIERVGRDTHAIAEALARELTEGGIEIEVGLRADGRRTTPVAMQVAAVPGTRALDAKDVVVVTGGARGVTAACVGALARAGQPKLALLGRTPLADEPGWAIAHADEAGLVRAALDEAKKHGREGSLSDARAQARAIAASREVRATLSALQAAGSHVLYLQADVQSVESVRAALAKARAKLGPITALVHGAGVLADKRIAEKSDEQFALVFDTKVRGLETLLEATRQDPLRLIVAFSSIAGRFGNAGQADYAMANETISKAVAAEARRRGESCVAKALAWGPWDGGMVDASLKAHFEAKGVATLALEEGARRFVAEIGAHGSEVVLIAGDAAEAGALQPRLLRKSLAFRVAPSTHAFLNDHRVRGDVVLPAVLALEWMTRAALAVRPSLRVAEILDLRVKRGARLERFVNGAWFFASAHETSNGQGSRLDLELRGADATLHYTARGVLEEKAPASLSAEPPIRAAGGSDASAYAGRLFHGPAFQVIRGLEALDADGASARLAGVATQAWGGGPWQTEAAALDGALQLAILWGREKTGSATLPTGIERIRFHADGPAALDLECRLSGRSASALRTLSDAILVDANGRPFAELRGIEMHAVAEKDDATALLESAAASEA